MNPELLEKGVDMQDGQATERNYRRYLELGGIIDEKDYENALERAGNAGKPVESRISQAEGIAEHAGIELHSQEDAVDERVSLYGILRSDVRPEGVRHHHSQITDQRIFMEVLRMLGDVESIGKMVEAYPNISFEYQRGADE